MLCNVRPATFIATLRGETVPGRAWHRLSSPQRSIGPRCNADTQRKRGQSQFATLKFRSLALVPSSGAQSAPPNSTCASSTARLFFPGYAAPVRDSRSFRGALQVRQPAQDFWRAMRKADLSMKCKCNLQVNLSERRPKFQKVASLSSEAAGLLQTFTTSIASSVSRESPPPAR